jgi:hypothetical protein
MLCRLSFISLGASLFFALTPSARGVSFSPHSYPNNNLWSQNQAPDDPVRADLNGDGREDFISENDASFNSGCGGSFAVTLSTGDGLYAAPVCYTVPSGFALFFAAGDFDHNGTMDVAVTNDSGDVYIYKNTAGNGTLTLGETITLDSEATGIVAADVNHDGLIDLVYETTTSTGTGELGVLLGNIDGTFTTGPISTFPASTAPAGYMAAGDIDGDTHTDVLANDRVYFGDGKGNFVAGPQAAFKAIPYQLFDFDSDGTMDMVGAPYAIDTNLNSVYYNYINLEWGHANRTLTSQHVPLKHCTVDNAAPQVADFDGDGIADLVVEEAADCSGNGPYTLNFMKGHGNGTFDPEQVIYTTSDFIWNTFVLRASHSSKPDLTLFQSQFVQRELLSPQQVVLVNTSAGGFPPCTPPNFRATGINVCGPTSELVTSPVHFAFGASDDVLGRDMEVWVDGRKVAESLKHTYTYHDFVESSVALSAGQHRVDVYSVGWDYTALWDSFPIYVGTSTCPVPGVGLNVCSPIDNSRLASPVTVYATSHGDGGFGISRMEIWVDGVKKYSTFGSQTLQTQLTLPAGWHRFDYYAVGMDGAKWEQTKWVEVK